jgi:hypothetical protein
MPAKNGAGSGLRGGGQVSGAAGDLQLPVFVVAAQDQYLGGVDAADDTADHGLAGEPDAEFLPCLPYASPTRDCDATGAPESGTPA